MRLSISGIAILMITSQIVSAEIVPPQGWVQDANADGIEMMSPGTSDADRVFYTIFPAQSFSGSFDAWFPQFVSALANKLGKASQFSGLSRQGGALLETVTILSSTGNKVHADFLGYVVGDKAETTLILIPQAVSEHDPRVVTALDHVKQLVDSKFLFPAKSATSSSLGGVSTAEGNVGPGKEFGEGLSGVYFGMGRRFALTPGSGLQGMNDVRIIVVLPDGKWRESLPLRGLETDIAADRRDFDHWGVWTASGGVVRATAQNDEVVLDAQSWTKLSPIDGLRTDGVFVVENSGWEGGGEPKLVLHADGTFEDRSGLSNFVGTTRDFDGVPKHLTPQMEDFVQKPGGGNYEFRNFTLLLRFSDGRVRRMSVYAPPNDNSKQPARLVVQDKVLVRRR